MLDFITIGGATRDIFFTYKDLKKKREKKSLSGSFLMIPYGEKLVSENTFYTYGGGAVNSSICISRLGGKVATICNIGREGTGSLVYQTLKKEGVITTMIERDPKHHTGLSIFILGKDNEHTGFLERGANDFLKIKKISLLRKAKWLYITSLTGESEKIMPQIFDYAKRANIKIAFNPGSKQIKNEKKDLEKYILRTDILILNMEEAETIIKNSSKNNYQNKRNLFLEIEKLGAKISVITDGQNGAHAIFEGKIYSQPAIKTDICDTTGAGDSFGSTFAFSIAKGFSIPDSLKIAAFNSASVVSKMGAQKGLVKYEDLRL